MTYLKSWSKFYTGSVFTEEQRCFHLSGQQASWTQLIESLKLVVGIAVTTVAGFLLGSLTQEGGLPVVQFTWWLIL